MANAYSAYAVPYITRRWMLPHITALLSKEFSVPSKRFPVFAGQFAIFQDSLVEVYWAATPGCWKRALDFYQSRMYTFDQEIALIIEEVQRLDGKRVGDIQLYFQYLARVLRASAILRMIDMAALQLLEKWLSGEEIGAVTFIEETFAGREEIALLKLHQERLDRRATVKKLQKMYDIYYWNYYGLLNERPVSFAVYQKKFFSIRNVDKRLEEIMQRKAMLRQKQGDLVKGLTTTQRKIVEIAQRSAYLKDYCKFGMNMCFGLGQRYWKKIAQKIEVDEEVVKQMLPEEVLGSIAGKHYNTDAIAERNHFMVFIGLLNEFRILSGKEAHAFANTYLKKKLMGRLSGRIASPGVGRGRARVVLAKKDFAKVRKGDVLVVSNTTPDFVPVMKKAAAIVAEEGGITAHVSVVSREFGVPCVVGIPHITKIIYDGEMVEVDADKGIVRRLPRK
ncbi:MAG TPA: PEP-utilizing enzyme [Candidatus Nanoarchaeia archaeon]|nr:PEP-utilizing enzyme [Candidatus Nanoarchaeia archaeon]